MTLTIAQIKAIKLALPSSYTVLGETIPVTHIYWNQVHDDTAPAYRIEIRQKEDNLPGLEEITNTESWKTAWLSLNVYGQDWRGGIKSIDGWSVTHDIAYQVSKYIQDYWYTKAELQAVNLELSHNISDPVSGIRDLSKIIYDENSTTIRTEYRFQFDVLLMYKFRG